jgi:Family of unknown function (DUF6185)
VLGLSLQNRKVNATVPPAKNAPRRSSLFRSRGLLWAILCIVVATSLWGLTQTPWWSSRFPAPDGPDLRVELDPPAVLGESRNLQLIRVSGRATRHSRVTLFVDKVRVGNQVTGRDHRFVFRAVQVRPGATKVEAHARSLGASAQQAGYSYSIWYNYEPAKPTTPSFSSVPGLTRTAYLALRGTADPGVEILLSGLGKLRLVTHANDRGSFTLEVLLPEPGKYVLTLQARNRNKVLSPPSAPVQLAYDPTLPSGEPQTKAALTLAISHKTLTPYAWVQLPKEDYRALDLIAGKVTTGDFLEEVFGHYILGEPGQAQDGLSLFPSYFRDRPPSFQISEQTVTFEIRGRRSQVDRLPVTSGDLEIERYGPGEGEDHVLRVKVQDYTAQTLSPAPRRWEKGLAEWAMDSRASQRIRIRLGYDPFRDTATFLRMLRLSPYSLLIYPWSVLVSAGFLLLQGIPLVWLLILLGKWRRLKGDPDAGFVGRLSRWLPALFFVQLMLTAAYGIAYILYEASEKTRSSDHPALLLAGISILALASIVLFLLSRWRPSAKIPHKVWSSLIEAFSIAALLAFAIISSAAALSTLPSRTLGPRIISLVLLATFSISLVLWLVEIYQRLCGNHLILSKRARIFAALVGIALAVPGSRKLSADVDIWRQVLDNSKNFFAALGSWLPYVALLGVLLLLKGENHTGQRREVREVRLAALLFAGFLVGVSANLFLVPIPFLIAIFIFPRFVLAPRERRHALGKSRGYVLTHRESLLRAILESSEARRFKEALFKLRKKVVSGEMTPRNFEQHRAEVEAFVGEPRFGRRPRALEASDAVLSVGPYPTNWENGLWALRCGALLAVPLVILYVLVFLLKDLLLQNPFRGLAVGRQLIGASANWLLGAFFLGYFFSDLQGTSGLRKGLRVSLAIVGCFLPVWFLGAATPDDLRALVLRAAQIVLFYTVLGVWAFDHRIFRQLPRKDFGWRELVDLEEVPSLTAFASVGLAGAGVVINAILSDPASSLLPLLAKLFFSSSGTAGPTPLP